MISVNKCASHYLGAGSLLAFTENRAIRMFAERAGNTLEGLMKNQQMNLNGSLRDS